VPIFVPTPELFISCALGIFGFCGSARAAAEEAPCVSPRIHLELESRPEWAAEIPALVTRLRALEHVDACAQVTIRAEPNGVSVNVTSGGRSASRLLTDPSELLRTVEALVVLPPPIEEPTRPAPVEVPPPEAPPAPRAAPSSHMEIGGAVSVRVGGSPLMVGGGVASFAGLLDAGWIFGVNARWNFADGFVAAPTPAGFNMQSGAIGFAVGRRAEAEPLAYDVLLGPTLVLESEEAFSATPGPSDGIGASALDARIDATFRASGPTSSRVRFYAAGDVEVSPWRAFHKKQLDPDLPPLPAWTSGLSLGLIWGAR
jgi:hypothetical protein